MIGYAPRKRSRPLWRLAATSPSDERLVAGDLPVDARLQRRRPDLVLHGETLARLAERVARVEGDPVRLRDLGPLPELALDELERRLGRAAVEPRHEAEREEVLRALRLARRHLGALDRLDGHGRERDGHEVVVAERPVLERARRVAGLLEVAVAERVGVDDQRAAARQVLEVRLQRRRVHRHEHVGLVARREDVVVGEVHLEAGDAGQRAGRRADLGGEVREGGEVVADERRLGREAVAGQLHTVAGIAGEPDDDVIELLDWLGH